MQLPRLNWPARTFALAFIYFASAKLGLSMAFVAPQVTTVWPPTGVALAAMLLLGSHAWPGIALGAFLANVTANEPVATAAGIAAGNTLEALAGSWLLRRAGFAPALERLRDVFTLVWWGALVSTTVSATIGVSSLCLGGVQPWSAFGRLWSTWWIGDMMGDLVFAPLLLVWASPPWPQWTARGIAEAAGLVAGLFGLTFVVFAGEFGTTLARYPLQYTRFPFIIWASLRFGQRGTTGVAFVASALAIWSTLSGFGPYVMGTRHESLAMLQLFIAIAAVTGLLLCAVISERDAAGDRLKVLSRRLIEIQESERRHFARELHDEIGQILTGLRFLLQGLSGLSPEATKRMAEAEHLVNNLCGQVRDLSLELRPAMLDDLGLLPALLWLFDRYTKQTGITVAFEHGGLPHRFAADQETAAYRIVQEALTNVARHAHVSAVTVRASVEDGVLGIQIADEGRGFDAEKALAVGTSGGLAGMRERALLVDGTLRITSVPGHRTEVSVYIPVNHTDRRGAVRSVEAPMTTSVHRRLTG